MARAHILASSANVCPIVLLKQPYLCRKCKHPVITYPYIYDQEKNSTRSNHLCLISNPFDHAHGSRGTQIARCTIINRPLTRIIEQISLLYAPSIYLTLASTPIKVTTWIQEVIRPFVTQVRASRWARDLFTEDNLGKICKLLAERMTRL